MEEQLKDCDMTILATIRTKYLQATPPLQIPELVNLFQIQTEKDDKATEEIVSKYSDQQAIAIIRKLHSMTVGFSLGESENANKESAVDDSNFLHPPIQYRITFTKFIIKQMECLTSGKCDNRIPHEHVENLKILLEDWYDAFEQLSSIGMVSEPFYRLYEIELQPPLNKQGTKTNREIVKIFENESSFVADGTTGLMTWKAAIEFVNWLNMVSNEKLNRNQDLNLDQAIQALESCKWILELGCGCGFLVVAVTKYLQSTLEKYIATDGSLAALEKAKENVEANFSDKSNKDDVSAKSKIAFERVDWENESTIESFSQLVDGMTGIYGTDSGVLLGTDIVFDPTQVPALVELIYDFLDKRSGTVLLSCTVRNPETMKSFLTETARKGLKINVCWKWEDGEIMQITGG